MPPAFRRKAATAPPPPVPAPSERCRCLPSLSSSVSPTPRGASRTLGAMKLPTEALSSSSTANCSSPSARAMDWSSSW